MLDLEVHERFAVLRLNDPARRNALSIAMFDAIDDALSKIDRATSVQAVLIAGAPGSGAFCAGFDLAAAVDDPELIATFIERLSTLTRRLRRMPQVVIAAVDGPAIAGGCAIVSACDFVVAAPDAMLGYPVHPIGVSPAVTIPTLAQRIGQSAARSLLMSGELINGDRARAIGLVTHVAHSNETLMVEAEHLLGDLAAKPPHALRVTKRWLNEIDGSLDDGAFDGPARGSAELARGEELRSMLAEHWRNRAIGPRAAT